MKKAATPRRGRPPSLALDAKTLKTIEGLGEIMATTKESAAVLQVSEPTFIKFLNDNPSAREAMLNKQGARLASLRRQQFAAVDKGNTTMMIWLGKNYLGQTDKSEITGANGDPVTFTIVHTERAKRAS